MRGCGEALNGNSAVILILTKPTPVIALANFAGKREPDVGLVSAHPPAAGMTPDPKACRAPMFAVAGYKVIAVAF